ncbi:MAG: LysR family transcriptional regulator substrate-binding protein [Adlercreutzia equolifaciens]
MRGLETGLIRIGVFPSVAAHWIPRIIKRFSADYPGIDYKLRVGDYTEIEEWIADGTVDCGFVLLPLRTDARLIARASEEDEFLAVLPRDHELAGAGVFPVERLAEFPLLSPASESDDELLEFLIRWGVRPTTRLTSWDDRAILSMVEYGMGVSVLSRLMLRGLSQNVVTLPLSDPVFRTIGVAYRSAGHLPWPPAASSIAWVSQRRGVSGGGLSELECRRNADGLSSELSRGQSVLFLVRGGRLRYYGSSSESWAQWRPTSFP